MKHLPIRELRMMIAHNRCEFCGSTDNLSLHHIVDRDATRRSNSEQWIASVRILCYKCHISPEKHKVLPQLRIEFDKWLLQYYTPDEAREITGRKLHYKGD